MESLEFYHVVLPLIAAIYVLAPLFVGRDEEYDLSSKDPEEGSSLVSRRAATLASLRDLDFEYQAGKLEEKEYDALRRRYVAEAASILRDIEATHADELAEIEKNVAQRRKSLAKS